MPLRDFLIAPREESISDETPHAGEAAESHGASASHDASSLGTVDDAGANGVRSLSGSARRRGVVATPSLGVLASARDLAAVAVAAGVVVARGSPCALVCVHAPGASPSAPPLRAPARGAASRLANSLRARGLAADAPGRVAVVDLAHGGEEAAGAARRALAAAGALPTVLAVAVRDPDLDALLADRDAILVALPPSADAALAELVATSAARLARVASISVTLDPATRALAVAGARAPSAVRSAVQGLVA
jgi:hypothetical protein